MISAMPAGLTLFVCAALFAAPLMAASTDTEKRVSEILSRMTVQEKIDLIGGMDFFYIRAVPRVGLPKLKMSDGPMGERNDETRGQTGGNQGTGRTHVSQPCPKESVCRAVLKP